MSHFRVFLKKELIEYSRNYKLWIMLTVFFIFGLMNPLTAKLTPELLANLLPEGVTITLPEPSSLDSWAQFHKNITQMGLIVTVLVFGGVLSSELNKGTLINLLTKGLSRTAVIYAKYAAMLTIWSCSLLTSFIVTWLYTIYLFPDGKSANLLMALIYLWLFGAFLLAVLLTAASLVTSSYGSLLTTGAVVVILLMLNIFPSVQKFNPISLVSKNLDLITQTLEVSSLYTAAMVTVFSAAVLLAAGVLVFRKKQL